MHPDRQCGLGIRPEFFDQVLENRPKLGFLEAHSENYFGESLSKSKLAELRKHYPISLHGVGLSLGRADDLDADHLRQLKLLVDEIDPIIVSEHLAWSAYAHRHIPDLLPLPLTKQSLELMCGHIDQMQQALGRQVLVENPSNYLLFDQLQVPEPEFLNLLAERTGCGLLVDVNNIYVSAQNIGRDPERYLQSLNSEAIGQYHIAGYTEVEREFGGQTEALLIDTHNQPVYEPVWSLFEKAIDWHGVRPTLFEWDSDFPEFSVLLDECQKATNRLCSKEATPKRSQSTSTYRPADDQDSCNSQDLASLQTVFLDDLLSLNTGSEQIVAKHSQRLSVYQNNFYGAMQSYLADVYPATMGVVGEDFFRQMVRLLLSLRAPSEGNIHGFGHELSQTLSHFEGLDALPYLSDLLEYEWALHSAYYSDIRDALDATSLPQNELLSLPVVLNDSVRIISSSFPLYEIHRQSLPTYRQEVSISLDQSCDSVLVYKHDEMVDSLTLNQAMMLILKKLQEYGNLLQAIEALSGSLDSNDIASSLSFIFEKQLLSPIAVPKELPH